MYLINAHIIHTYVYRHGCGGCFACALDTLNKKDYVLLKDVNFLDISLGAEWSGVVCWLSFFLFDSMLH